MSAKLYKLIHCEQQLSSLMTSVACELWLTEMLALRDFGKFLLDPTSLLWTVYFVVIKIWEIKSGRYRYR